MEPQKILLSSVLSSESLHPYTNMAYLCQFQRIDGRQAYDYRHLKIGFGLERGCCHVDIGDTRYFFSLKVPVNKMVRGKVLGLSVCRCNHYCNFGIKDAAVMSSIYMWVPFGKQFETAMTFWPQPKNWVIKLLLLGLWCFANTFQLATEVTPAAVCEKVQEL